MSLNKEKVDEILADMKEEERKKQEAIEAEVDKFLENRLEYYVAMILNGEVKTPEHMLGKLIDDGCKNYEFAMEVIDKGLAECDWYRCLVLGAYEYHTIYMSIYDSSTDDEQFDHFKERQIELGLRIDMKKQMDIFEKWIKNGTYKQSVSTEERNEKQKTTNNSPKIILVVIIISLILLFAFLK